PGENGSRAPRSRARRASSEVIIGPAAMTMTSTNSAGSSIPAAAMRSRSRPVACIAPINARRPPHASCVLSPAGRAGWGGLDPAFLLATTGERAPALLVALPEQPWMRHRYGTTRDGGWGRADGADGRPSGPTDRRRGRIPRGSRGGVPRDGTEARGGLEGRPADLEGRRPRPRGEPGLPRIAEPRRVAARSAEARLRPRPCQLPGAGTARRDRPRRSVVHARHGMVRHVFDVVPARGMAAPPLVVLPAVDDVVGDQVMVDHLVDQVVRTEVALVHEDELLDDEHLGREGRERRPADEAVAPEPVDPGGTPDGARHPSPPAGQQRPAPVVEGPAPRLGRHPRPAVRRPRPVAVGVG